MKIKLRLLLFWLIAIFVQPLGAQTKLALIIAIGNYPKLGGWQEISSIRDASYIKNTLQKQGFAENNIKTVSDSSATVMGITNALTELINIVGAGDIVAIHFSSHGEQVEDDNGDETDGKDETVVTYNAIAPTISNKKDFKINQAQYFRDDQFGVLINRLRRKLGKNGDIIVFMDLCHSGTGTRGNAKIRGGLPPLVSEGFNESRFARFDTAGVFREADAVVEDKQGLATYAVFSASRAEELDYETVDEFNEGMGSLSYAICKAFENLEAGITYRGLFARIQRLMGEKTPGQHPVLEGNGIDRMLFGGSFVQQKPYAEIEKIDGRVMTIKAGLLAGVDAGAKVSLYPAGTINPEGANLLSAGTVIKADNYTATVNLASDPGIKQAVSGWVFITEPVYKTKPVVINILSGKTRGANKEFSEEEVIKLKDGLSKIRIVKLTGEPELIITKGETMDSLKIASNGYLFATIKNIGSIPEEMERKIAQYVQYKFLAGLEIKDKNTSVEIKLVPVIGGKADISKLETKVVKGGYEFAEGDKFVLWVKNTGNMPSYINVLDLQPDGIINPILPFKERNIYPADLKIDAGTTRLFENYVITISPPFGLEIFKFFVSKKEIDLQGIASTRGESQKRGNFSILEKLVLDSYTIGARGASTENISNADGSTYDLLFTIKTAR